MKYKLLVVTVTYKPDILELCAFVDSFIKYNDLGQQAKLIIVDNSPKGFWDISVFAIKYPTITLIKNPENQGFGASNNKGFEIFKSEYVLFMNNDAEFVEPVFREILSVFADNPNLGCVGIHQEGGAPSFFARSESLLGKKELKKRMRLNQFDPVNFFLSGAFLMLPSSVFIEVGKFDPLFFMYCEESDLINRLVSKQYEIRYLPELSFLHKVKNRKRKDEYLCGEVLSRSYCYYLQKYHYGNYKYLFFSRYKTYYKLICYFVLLFDLREVMKLLRIISTSTRIYREFFPKNQTYDT